VDPGDLIDLVLAGEEGPGREEFVEQKTMEVNPAGC
jgi:hypothetical protein